MESTASGVAVSALAHSLIGISLIWDKVLLGRRETSHVVSYVFWLGFLSFVGVVVAAFGFQMPRLPIVLLGLCAGLAHIVSVFFYYVALKKTEASRAPALMGGLSPVATALIAVPLLARPLAGASIEGFVLMTAGGFVMFFSDRLGLEAILLPAVVSAATAGLSDVLQKLVFEASGFTSGYPLFVLGSAAGSSMLLLRPAWRAKIRQQSRAISMRSRIAYLANRALSGLGSLLVYFAISLTSPALVSAISGLRYVIIFVGTYALTRLRPRWLHEEFTARAFAEKLVATLLVLAGLVLVGLSRGRV